MKGRVRGSIFSGRARTAPANSPIKNRGLSLGSHEDLSAAVEDGAGHPHPNPQIDYLHRYVEFDINLHEFPYIAKNALVMLHQDCFPKMITNVGVVIEARSEDELPEALLASAKLVKVHKKDAMDENEFWSNGENIGEM